MLDELQRELNCLEGLTPWISGWHREFSLNVASSRIRSFRKSKVGLTRYIEKTQLCMGIGTLGV